MERNEIFEKMKEICKDVFDDDELDITEELTASDVDGWDSLTHLSLVNELEETFSIEFTLDEVSNSQNLGELLNAIMKHITKQ